MLNKWAGAGRLVRDPEIRTTAAGKAVASFTIAIDRDYKTEGGETPTDFVEISAWGASANFASKYLSKGRMVAVVGRLQSDKWTDKEGNKRTSWSIRADSIYPVDSRKASDSTPPPASPGEDYAEIDEDDGELPF